MATAHNPFGAPSAQTPSNPFSTNTFAQQPSSNPSPFAGLFKPANDGINAATQPSPFAPATGATSGSPFGQPAKPTSNSLFAPSSQPSSRQPSPSTQSPFNQPASPFGALAQPAKNPAESQQQPLPQTFGIGHTGGTDAMTKRRANVQPAKPPIASSIFTASATANPDHNAVDSRKKTRGESRINTNLLNGRLAKAKGGIENIQRRKDERSSRSSSAHGQHGNITGSQPTEMTKELSPFAFDFAKKVDDQLRRDRINAPQWPEDPANPSKRGQLDKLKENYRSFRERAYASLRKADIIDDPEKRRRLEDALAFKGICEDMCPGFERVSRIVENDVKLEETEMNGVNRQPAISRMVKKFARSAAGQEAPLPMDVRSVAALRRSTEYLLDELLQTEGNLPSMHRYLWDRTRAVRKDFTLHSTKSAEEMKVLVYCFEAITRFHATSLHLLSRPGFAPEDFDQKQEIEQLANTLLSLVQAYDDCRKKKIECENEAEFRAYYILLNANDSFMDQRMREWGDDICDSEEVQTAISLIEAMKAASDQIGPMRPMTVPTMTASSFTNFFSIVENPRVSYTMGCVAEIHFTHVRQCILRSIVKAYSRPRDSPKDITASTLNQMLRFDTDEEAADFAEQHDMQFSDEDGRQPFLELKTKKKIIPWPRVLQSHSATLVERKRTSESLPDAVFNTIYEDTTRVPAAKPQDDSPDSMFVSQLSPDDLFGPDTSSEGFGQAKPAPFTGDTSAATKPSISQPPSFGFNGQNRTGTPGFGAANGSAPNTGDHEASLGKAPVSAPSGSTGTFSFLNPSSQASSTAAPSPFSAISQPQPASISKAPGFGTSPFPPTTGSQLATPGGEPSSTFGIRGLGSTNSFAPAAAPKDAPSIGFKPSTTAATAPSVPAQGTPTAGVGFSTPSTFAEKASRPSFPQTSTTNTQKQFFPAATAPTVSPTAVKDFAAPSTVAAPATGGQPQTSTTRPADAKPIFGSSSATPTTLTPGDLPAASKPAKQVTFAPDVTVFGGSKSSASSLESATSSAALIPAPTTSISAPAPPPVPKAPKKSKKELMDDLTRWFVLGDGGMMGDFTELYVHNLIAEAVERHAAEEEERKRKEEDERSWKEARAHQAYNLSVKYFYRWQKNARSSAQRRILQDGKAKMRAYLEKERERELKMKKEAEIKARREARDKEQRAVQATEDAREFLEWSQRRSSAEQKLLASGVFAGLRDERRTVRRIVDEVARNDQTFRLSSRSGSPVSTRSRAATENMSPPARPVGDRIADVLKKEGWKTRSLREQFDGSQSRRRSFTGSSVNGASSSFSQSVPTASRSTNFGRKRSADTPSEDERGRKRLPQRSTHWDLRARGFVPMPNGKWLPEAVANSMQDGKRFEGIGDYGLGPGSEFIPSPSSDGIGGESQTDRHLQMARLRLSLGSERSFAREQFDKAQSPVSPSPENERSVKRKRVAEYVDDTALPNGAVDGNEEGGAEGGSGAPTTKRMIEDTQEMLRELHEVMDKMDEGSPWIRQQMEMYSGDGVDQYPR